MLLPTRSPNLYSGVEEASETKPERYGVRERQHWLTSEFSHHLDR